MHDFKFSDCSLTVRISGEVVRDILTHAAASKTWESGGVLLGIRSEDGDEYRISHVGSPPIDSVASAHSFVRGHDGVATALRNAQAQNPNVLHLGEWRSRTDHEAWPTMQEREHLLEGPRTHIPVVLVATPCGEAEWGLYAFSIHEVGDETESRPLPLCSSSGWAIRVVETKKISELVIVPYAGTSLM